MDWRYFGNNHRDHWCLNSRTWNLWRLWWTLCCGERWDCSGLSQWFVCRTFNFLGSVLYDVLMLPHPTKHTPHMHDQVLWGRMAIPIANQHFLWGLCAWSVRSSNASVPALSTWCWLCPELQPRPYLASFKRKLTPKDKRRLQKNKAVKKHQMVKKTISKSGKVQVYLDLDLTLTTLIPGCWMLSKLKPSYVNTYAFMMVVCVCSPCLRTHVMPPKNGICQLFYLSHYLCCQSPGNLRTGSHGMRASAVYPRQFAKHLATQHKAFMARAPWLQAMGWISCVNEYA